MKIVIEVIPHSEQRYPTAGDWYWERAPGGEDFETAVKDNVLRIFASKLENSRHSFLIALHEMIEAMLCTWHQVNQEEIDRFDFNFQGAGEPGDSREAPYHDEHVFATAIERMTAEALSVWWWDYERAVDRIFLEGLQPVPKVSPPPPSHSEDDDIPF